MVEKYKRSLIKLGNSIAVTFPQEWVQNADLKEKSEITLYKIDDKSLLVKAIKEEDKENTIYDMDTTRMSLKLIRQAILSAFKLNVDEIYLKYNKANKDDVYELLIELRREIIGIDFKDMPDTNQFFVNFLLDASKTNINDVIEDLVTIFNTIITNIANGETNKISDLLLDEIERKYSLGTRMLIIGLAKYLISPSKLPVIRFLGDRVILLYIRDFIQEARMNLQQLPYEIIKQYKDLLLKIPQLLKNITDNYNNINLKTITRFQDYLFELREELENTEFKTDQAICHIKNSITYYLNSFKNFLDIGITRMIESDIGMSGSEDETFL